jgi:hypothetical protein
LSTGPSGYSQPNFQWQVWSVSTVAARRLDHRERIEVKINDGLERLGGRRVAERIG